MISRVIFLSLLSTECVFYIICVFIFSSYRKHDKHVRIKNVIKNNDGVSFYFEISL